MKIVYCINDFSRGGIEKVTIIKANALSAIPGYEVLIMMLNDMYEPMIPLSPKVKVVNLNIDYQGIRNRNLVSRIFCTVKTKLAHFRAMRKNLNIIKPDVVISTSGEGCHLLQFVRVASHPMKIREYHFTRNYMEFMSHTILSKASVCFWKFYDFSTRFLGYDYIVVLSEEEKKIYWKGMDNVVVIPNPLATFPEKTSNCEEKTVITAGRLHPQKNQVALVRLWRMVYEKHPDWQLQIWGDGPLREDLQKQINETPYSSNIHLMGFTADIYEKMAQGSIFVLTSIFEGFGMVITEAMACGIPVVSYDCPTGPSEIIIQGENGYLVPMHAEEEIADKINLLIENVEMRKKMGLKAKESAKFYSLEKILPKWTDILRKTSL